MRARAALPDGPADAWPRGCARASGREAEARRQEVARASIATPRHASQLARSQEEHPMTHSPDLSRATDFVWRTARLIDRRRFEFLFLGAEHQPALEALRPYQNPDGGFGNTLEPDIRAPVSQPIPTWTALCILDELAAFDDPMVARACDYLLRITTPEGGVPFALPTVRD